MFYVHAGGCSSNSLLEIRIVPYVNRRRQKSWVLKGEPPPKELKGELQKMFCCVGGEI